MVLYIIKIIMIVLIVIIILLVLLCLISLDYDIKVLKDISMLKAYIDVKYLFGLVRFKAIYSDGLLYNMRALFFKFTNKKEKPLRDDVPVKAITKQPIDEADYIFYDRDELLSSKYDVKSLKMSEKKNRELAKKREKKKDKKGIIARIIDIKKGKKLATAKKIWTKIKQLIAEIKPDKTSLKFDIFGFDVKLVGKIIPLRLIGIFLQVYLDKDTRKLIFG